MSYYNDPVVPKSITKEVRKELNEALRINNQLRSEVDRLAAELAARTEERDAALTLAEPLDRLYEWAKRTIRADLHSPLEVMGEYESLREERDGFAAALRRVLDEDEARHPGDFIGVNPAACLDVVQARAKSEGLREAAKRAREIANSGVWRYAGLTADELDRMAAQAEKENHA